MQASNHLKINYSTAKSIIQNRKGGGRKGKLERQSSTDREERKSFEESEVFDLSHEELP